MKKLTIRKLSDLLDAARDKGKKRIAVAYAQDAHTLEAINDAVQQGIADAILIGDATVICEVCAREGIDPDRFTVVDEPNVEKCVEIAVRMVSEGRADVLMKGLVSSDKYMRGILNKEYGLVPTGGTLSHVVVLEFPGYKKLLIAGDVVVIPYPDLKQKSAIMRYLIATARTIGIERPKIACIAPSEQLLPGVASSTDAALLSKMAERGQFGKVDADGPLALDVALFAELAKTKKLTGSPVAGDADCLLFPNLDAANVFFKCATQLCHVNVAALVAGAKAPCILTSRVDTRESKLYSIALACLSAK